MRSSVQSGSGARGASSVRHWKYASPGGRASIWAPAPLIQEASPRASHGRAQTPPRPAPGRSAWNRTASQFTPSPSRAQAQVHLISSGSSEEPCPHASQDHERRGFRKAQKPAECYQRQCQTAAPVPETSIVHHHSSSLRYRQASLNDQWSHPRGRRCPEVADGRNGSMPSTYPRRWRAYAQQLARSQQMTLAIIGSRWTPPSRR